MKKNPASKSGVFNPRVFLALLLCSGGVLLAMLSFAASRTPSGMTTPAAPPAASTSVPSVDAQKCAALGTVAYPRLLPSAIHTGLKKKGSRETALTNREETHTHKLAHHTY